MVPNEYKMACPDFFFVLDITCSSVHVVWCQRQLCTVCRPGCRQDAALSTFLFLPCSDRSPYRICFHVNFVVRSSMCPLYKLLLPRYTNFRTKLSKYRRFAWEFLGMHILFTKNCPEKRMFFICLPCAFRQTKRRRVPFLEKDAPSFLQAAAQEWLLRYCMGVIP